jgi:hypothetical protein
MTLREFIWERCEMDDNKTDEIIQLIRLRLPKMPKEIITDRNNFYEGFNYFHKKILEVLQ